MAGQATPATAALTRGGIEHQVHSYGHDPAVASFGSEAAEALDVAPARVLKTLLVRAGAKLVVAVVPVTGSLDLKALAAAVGSKRAVMAEPVEAERVTGYVRGGISPLGQRRQLPTVVDSGALEHDTVFVSGGRRGMDLELAPDDLIRLTGARVADIAGPG